MKFDPEPERFTRSITEYNRQMEELMESRNRPTKMDLINQYIDYRDTLENLKNPKSVKEAAIRKIRELESRYPDIFTSRYPEYNGKAPVR